MMMMYIVDTEEKSYMREEDETKYLGNDRGHQIDFYILTREKEETKK